MSAPDPLQELLATVLPSPSPYPQTWHKDDRSFWYDQNDNPTMTTAERHDALLCMRTQRIADAIRAAGWRPPALSPAECDASPQGHDFNDVCTRCGEWAHEYFNREEFDK